MVWIIEVLLLGAGTKAGHRLRLVRSDIHMLDIERKFDPYRLNLYFPH